MKLTIVKAACITVLLIFSLSAADKGTEQNQKKSCITSCSSHCCTQKKEVKSCTSKKSFFDNSEEVEDHNDID